MNYFLTLKAALSYIEHNLREDIDGGDVARLVGFSPSHFNMVFRTAMGMPPASYIRGRRLVHAAKDLAEGRERVVEIALRYGFESHETFTRAFSRQFGQAPSAFRSEHTSYRIPIVTPGIFGPMLNYKEESNMEYQKGLEKFEGGAVLHGVPKVSYFGNPPELTPYIASLKTAMQYAGVADIPYAHYHCTAGSAFRLMWNTAYWDGGNVDILVMDENPAAPLTRAIKAAGRAYRILFKDTANETHLGGRLRAGEGVEFGGKAELIELIKGQIDRGIPVVVFGVMGPPEACVVTGYRENGEALLGWNYFQDMKEMVGDVEKTDEGYFLRRGWFEHKETIGAVAIGEPIGGRPLREDVRDALENAVKVMSPRRFSTYEGGLNAFEAWAAAIGRKADFPENAPLPLLFERLMCQNDAHTEVAEGRSYAHGWLEHMAQRFPEAAEPMGKAAKLFDRSHRTVWEMWDILGGIGMGEKQARNMGDDGVRAQLVERIHKLRQYDEQAIPSLAKAAELLK